MTQRLETTYTHFCVPNITVSIMLLEVNDHSLLLTFLDADDSPRLEG